MKKGKWVEYLIRAAVCASAILFFTLWGCPFFKLFGIPCPCCGTTRAFLSLFSGDIAAAFSYHPLFLIMPFILIFFAFEDCLKISARTKKYIVFISVGAILTTYVIRLCLMWAGYSFFPQ